MKTIRALLGNSEGLLNNFMEVLLQDACAEIARVHCTWTKTLDEFLLHGASGRYDVAVVIPNNLMPALAPGEPRLYDAVAETAAAIRQLRKRSATPVITVGVFDRRAEQEKLLLEAGAATVLELPFSPKLLSEAVRKVLFAPVERPPARAERSSISRSLAKRLRAVSGALGLPSAPGLSGQKDEVLALQCK
jgi:CheY-like chemotaxis protein